MEKMFCASSVSWRLHLQTTMLRPNFLKSWDCNSCKWLSFLRVMKRFGCLGLRTEIMADRILKLRELNRATLARQMLLEREILPIHAAIERLVGLQAQLAS